MIEGEEMLSIHSEMCLFETKYHSEEGITLKL